MSQEQADLKSSITTRLLVGVVFLFVAGCCAFVPFYRRFCQVQNRSAKAEEVLQRIGVVPNPRRRVRVRFEGRASEKLQWTFQPEQDVIEVTLGEPALAFYRAKNTSDRAVVGVATYTILPFSAAQHFHKIQCFCFEEQRLDPGDEVLMPVFFYIEPEFDDCYENLASREVILSYNFYVSLNSDYINERVEELRSAAVQPPPVKMAPLPA